ncbi:hypothetical protein BS47DRAFT_1147675 [Hydnum rufescens UP504]|uniref:Uncharacterized protein n=1 Tax=Hydnum rufescens UP504 TaxID=1448309 RepID=A0A9P6AUK4_9AGAM|nr:hypothetical protein BS47DRAFT_1147675 [Hydnum rufescens UP504]
MAPSQGVSTPSRLCHRFQPKVNASPLPLDLNLALLLLSCIIVRGTGDHRGRRQGSRASFSGMLVRINLRPRRLEKTPPGPRVRTPRLFGRQSSTSSSGMTTSSSTSGSDRWMYCSFSLHCSLGSSPRS